MKVVWKSTTLVVSSKNPKKNLAENESGTFSEPFIFLTLESKTIMTVKVSVSYPSDHGVNFQELVQKGELDTKVESNKKPFAIGTGTTKD